MPITNEKIKAFLSAKLTEAFVDSTGFDGNIFSIHYCEYTTGEAAVGGKLWNEQNGIPYLHLVLYCPRLRRNMKQKVVESMTTAFIECVGNSEWKPIIHISEHPYDNVGVNGKLLSDSYEECAKKKFYYELPND